MQNESFTVKVCLAYSDGSGTWRHDSTFKTEKEARKYFDSAIEIKIEKTTISKEQIA